MARLPKPSKFLIDDDLFLRLLLLLRGVWFCSPYCDVPLVRALSVVHGILGCACSCCALVQLVITCKGLVLF